MIGATGALRSIYFYDPDENLIEVANRLDDPSSEHATEQAATPAP